MVEEHRSVLQALLICTVLIVVTALTMGRMVWDQHGFVLYDDTGYITLNHQVRSGLSWQTVKWAFDPKTVVVGNYHPLTNLSHALDVQLFGVGRPWAHHLMSLLIHMANSVLLFLVLRRMTGDDWPSALVAALFAWHPLHVESVAWAAERKDLLSGFFWILAMWFYTNYARGSKLAYAGVFVCLLLGLLAKPMVVTLPFALLLLDVWPLKRVSFSEWRTPPFRQTAWRLAAEKLPLLGLVALSIPLTVHAQASAQAMVSAETMSLWVRLINVFSSYNAYLLKTAWPAGLAIPYPLEMRELTYGSLIFGAFGFAVVTYLVLDWGRKYPYLPVGWFWFVGTLLPVIGLVQVGSQAMADRYMYLPMIGLAIAFAWSLQDFARNSAWAKHLLPAAMLVVLACLVAVSYRQVGYWRDSVSLFSRTTSVFPDHANSQTQLALAYMEQGDWDKALLATQRAIDLQPSLDTAWFCKGVIQTQRDELDDAIAAIQKGLELAPKKIGWLTPLGWLYLRAGQITEADQNFRKALEINPNNVSSRLGRGASAKNAGRREDALRQFAEVQKIAGENAAASIMTARLLATSPESATADRTESIRLAELACSATADVPSYWLDTLAASYAANDRFEDAINTAQRAYSRALEQGEQQKATVIAQHLAHYHRGERLTEDVTAIPAHHIIEFDKENPLQQLFRVE